MGAIRSAVLLAFAAASMHAAVYYVDQAGGADTQDGLSPDTAWSSLARVNSTQFAPGDYVLLKRGQVWGEPLVISASGFSDAPVVFGAYGSGSLPAIDGSAMTRRADLVSLHGNANVVLSNLEIRNSPRSGINAYGCSQLIIRGVVVWGNMRWGIMIFNGNSVLIEDAEVYGNSLDLTAGYDGIRIDGGAGQWSGFTIRNSKVHGNIGGSGWYSANGIFLGHTGGALTTLNGVEIAGNEIYSNGNPSQNQAGRGITGIFQGDVTVDGNYVHHSASAGIYLGDEGVPLTITLTNNIFYDNALRQFGGYTTTGAYAARNLILVDDPSITAMGAEVGGTGAWQITNNTFYYTAPSSDTYRGFIRINDASQQAVLSSDTNLFYSPSPDRWILSNGAILNFQQWQAAGFDPDSAKLP